MQAAEAAPAMVAAFGYRLHHYTDGSSIYLTNWQRPLETTGNPAAWSAATPQEWTPAQITHGEITQSAAWEKRSIQVHLPVTDERLRRYFTTAAAVRIGVHICRFNTEKLLDGEVLNFATDGHVKASGVFGLLSFSDQAITGDITPEPFLSDQSVPRHFFERRCNHVFGAAGTCNVDLTAHRQDGDITALDRLAFRITTDIVPPTPTHYTGGTIRHPATGQLLGIVSSDDAGPGGTARVTLRSWPPEWTTGQSVQLTAGCFRTVADCRDKFSNEANFGGFPWVPNRNPSIHGA